MTRPAATHDAVLLVGSSRPHADPCKMVQESASSLHIACNGVQGAAIVTGPLAQESERTGAVRDTAAPEPQRERGRRNCDCGSPCFYCDGPVIRGQHAHDHMPIPWRHGGRETVPACNTCHRLKDLGRGVGGWPPASQAAAMEGLSGPALLVAAMFLDITRDPFSEPFDLSIDRDQALSLVQRCTTTEARIFAARLVCLVLDEAEHLAAVTSGHNIERTRA